MENTANTHRPARSFEQDMLNGKTVLGVSPSWTGALALGEAHGIAATTDQRLVLDLAGGDLTLTKDHVIVCKGLDGGEYVETVKAIQKAAGKAGATVILMGDPLHLETVH
ncbi:TPA: hypothetical protein QDB01_000329 [Burkholderia vietnamiensis]|nr:hypothetical protein [Burkholderia vietnamiensis]